MQTQWVDPREGPGGSSLPHLFLDQTEAQRAKKYIFGDHPSPPLSQGLDPALIVPQYPWV